MSNYTVRQRRALNNAPIAQRSELAREFRLQNSNRNIMAPRGNGRNRRAARRNLPSNLRSNYLPPSNNRNNVGNTYPPNSMIIPRNPSFQQQASNVMAIQHVTSPVRQGREDLKQAMFFAMRPCRQGYNALTGMFGEYRYVNLEMRFVSTSPSTTPAQVGIGYSPATHLLFGNSVENLSSLRGFWFGNASKSSEWMRIISPPDTTTQFLQNRPNTDAANGNNSQGYLYYCVAGGENTTDTKWGTVAGNIEIRGQVQFRAPI